MKALLQAAKAAKSEIGQLNTQQKNAALEAMAAALIASKDEILQANAEDLCRAFEFHHTFGNCGSF